MLQQASTFFDTLTIQENNMTHERVGFAPGMHLSASMKPFFHAVANIEATGQKVEQLWGGYEDAILMYS